ncbi:hypothetical protein K437DRAFT_233807 [Tilletiaria anomala UBC 951]|uniref:HTH APSES-type domain-containing protein n=1 Tax=Tilletiaria anomala (strain ATCC 24038 / CBS 436.72 / UBC 951) TaxID=1037660 RepID=A0A066WEP1_TILAU|nr:uncharacterized protein K437DRAFT_233807 [Tilletiaria anomala UBC 951]KDN49559.1 hypothetical protein K437DRAFT_233807 [Tilletiaria anomala UBC 951]
MAATELESAISVPRPPAISEADKAKVAAAASTQHQQQGGDMDVDDSPCSQAVVNGATAAKHAGATVAPALIPAPPIALQHTGPTPRVYLATYSSVPVYELTVRGIAVMRRRADGFLNATQILKVAGIEKGRRTKILEKEILTGEHEKVQGGYGKYQGTWIPLKRAQELSAAYNVAHLLKPVLEFDPASAANLTAAPKGKRPNPNAPSAQRLNNIHSASSAAGSTLVDVAVDAESGTGAVAGVGAAAGTAAATGSGAVTVTVAGAGAGVATDVDADTTSQEPRRTSPSVITMENGSIYGPGASAGTAGAPSQAPRFLRLRPPPPPAGSLNDTDTSVANGSTGTGSGMSAGEDNAAAAAAGSFTPNKRARFTAPGVSRDHEAMQVDGPDSVVAAATEDNVLLSNTDAIANPSPVRDLNNLGPAGGCLRAASGGPAALAGAHGRFGGAHGTYYGGQHHHARSARIVLGPPDHLARSDGGSGARYADRAQAFKGVDEAQERPLKEILTNLFLEEEHAGAAAAKRNGADDVTGRDHESDLKQLLGRMSAAISLGHGQSGAASTPSSSSAAPASRVPFGNPDNPNVSVNIVIDDHGHTPLHWAAALSKLPLLRTLLARPVEHGGANVHAGNFAGETALHRSVLVTNSYEAGTFPSVLALLAPSLMTGDYKRRTILHHIAMVAALKGRAAPARYYLACVLEYLAQAQQQQPVKGTAAAGASAMPISKRDAAALIDAQDESGETALGIVARIGNASMVRMLLEVRARKDIVNHFGIRPSDWGLEQHLSAAQQQQQGEDPAVAAPAGSAEGEATKLAGELANHRAHDIVAAIAKPPRPPMQRSQDVLGEIQKAVEEVKQVYEVEMAEKQKKLAAAQAQLQRATRDLASRRRIFSEVQAKVAQRDEHRNNIANLKRMIGSLREAAIAPGARAAANEAFVEQQIATLEVGGNAPAKELVRLRWLYAWLVGSSGALEKRIAAVQQEAKTKEAQCRKVVAMCCGVEEDRVLEILDDLVVAIESDGAEMDLSRVAGFLSKVSSS